MKVIKKRLDDLKHPEKNVRIHSEQQIRELKRSLEKFGQTRALVVDENNVILIGNGLYEAMVSLGYQEASVYVSGPSTSSRSGRYYRRLSQVRRLVVTSAELVWRNAKINL